MDFTVSQITNPYLNVRQTIGVAREPFSGSSNVTHTFSQPMTGFVISNDGTNDLTFTIGNYTFIVKSGEVYEDSFDSFTQVLVSATSAFRAYGKVQIGAGGAVSTTPIISSPIDVTGLAASNISSATLTLTWTTSSGATSYDVYQGSTLLGNITSTTYNVSGLSASTSYTFKVIAKNASGSAPGTGLGATTTATTSAPPQTAPADITGLAANSITTTSLTLNWTSSPTATSYDVYNGAALLGNTTGVTYNVTGLTSNTPYTFQVIAKNSAGSAPGTGSGASVSATTLVSAPADVTGLSSSGVTQTTLTLTWTGSTGATSYDVYNGATLLTNVTNTSYSVSGLTAGTLYTFKVIAKNAGGSAPGTGNGSSVNVTTVVAAPADVTNLSVSNLSSTTLTLNWTSSPTATSYDVYNGATLLGNTASLNYNVTGLTTSTSYTFKVVAKNAGGSSTGVTVNATTIASAPNPVTNLVAGTVTSNSVPVSWTYTNGTDAVANFEVAYSSDGGSTYTVSSGLVNPSSTSYTVTGLTPSTSYTIRVVAIDASSNRSTAVTVSTTTAASAAPNPVTNLAVGTMNPSTVPLTWTAPSGGSAVADYEVAYSTDGTNFTVASSTVTATSYLVTGLHQSTNYTFRVVAIDGSGNRSTAVTTTATTPALTVTASPVGGSYYGAQSVTLTTNGVSGTVIYYTTDGTTPTTSSPVYSSAISVSASETLKYYAVNPVGDTSTVQSQTYTIGTMTITASPVSGTYASNQSITLTTNVSGGTIYYTTDGSLPTTSSTKYTTPIAMNSSGTVRAIVVDAALNQSSVQPFYYYVNLVATGGHYSFNTSSMDAKFQASSIQYDEIVLDITPNPVTSTSWQYYIDMRNAGLTNGYFARDTSNHDTWGNGFASITVNGTSITSGTTAITPGTRQTIDIKLAAVSTLNGINGQVLESGSEHMNGDIYFVKLLKGGNVVCSFDFTNEYNTSWTMVPDSVSGALMQLNGSPVWSTP